MSIQPENDPCPYGPQYQVYWNMRHSLFSKFDRCKVDAHGLYTMFHEAQALGMAKMAKGPIVLDVCSGIGSMSIAMARAGNKVTAIEIDKKEQHWRVIMRPFTVFQIRLIFALAILRLNQP